MTRRFEQIDSERQALLRSLIDVGPSKPVGYLPFYAIKDFVQLSPETIAANAATRGLAVAEFGPDACCIKSGALFVYDWEALACLLQSQADAVSQAGLPDDPDRFVAHIAAVWYAEDHPARQIIASAFGERS
jgi:hypothetical protein